MNDVVAYAILISELAAASLMNWRNMLLRGSLQTFSRLTGETLEWVGKWFYQISGISLYFTFCAYSL